MADISIIVATNAKEVSNEIGGMSNSLMVSEKRAKQLAKAFKFLDTTFNSGKIDADQYSKAIQKLDREETELYSTLGKTTSALNNQSSALVRNSKTASAASLAASKLANAQRMSGKATNRFGMYSQQVGYQVGDFLVQVQGGTNAMLAFGQQGTQLAGLIPGIGGAIVGIGLSLATAIALSTGATEKISYDWRQLLEDLQVGVEGPTSKVVSFFSLMWEGIKSFINKVVDRINFMINSFRVMIAVVAALPKAMKAGFDGIPAMMGAAASKMTMYFVDQLREMLLQFSLFTQSVAEGLNNLFGTNLSGVSLIGPIKALDSVWNAADNMNHRLTKAAQGTENAVTVIQDAINSVKPVDIRDYFGGGAGGDEGGGSGGGSSSLEKTLAQIEAEKKLALAYGVEAERLRLIVEIKDQLGDSVKNYTESAIAGAADRILAYEKEQEALRKADEQTQSIADTLKSSMSDAFMSMVDGTKSFKDAMKDMARAVIKQLFDVLVVQQLVGSFNKTTGAKSGIVGSIFSAFGFADGGAFSGGSQVKAYANGGVVGGPTYFPMAGGKTGLMAEAGPEAIMPLKRGANGKLGVQMEGNAGGDVVINQSFNFQANGDDSVKRIIQQQIPRITEATKAAVVDSKRRGGSFGRAF